MSKKVDWVTPAEILNNATDEEIQAAMEKLNPFPGMTASEAVEAELKWFQDMGIMPVEDDITDEEMEDVLEAEEGLRVLQEMGLASKDEEE